MTYNLCKRLIGRGATRENMLSKLDVFLLADRLTNEQYNELVAMLPAE